MINLDASSAARKRLKQYKRQIIGEAKRARLSGNDKPGKNDYPAVIVACEDDSRKIIDTGRSRSTGCKFGGVRSDNLHPAILRVLKFLYPTITPPVVKSSPQNKEYTIYIGTCAEDDAASKVLKHGHVKSSCYNLQKLHFTQPVRPASGQDIDPCITCQKVFG